MSSLTTAQKTLLDRRDKLVKEYDAATTPGVKAARTRQIPQTEVDMVIAGFTPVPTGTDPVKVGQFIEWSGPVKVTNGKPSVSAEELLTQIANARGVRYNSDMSESLRHAADVRLSGKDGTGGLYKVAADRGIAVPAIDDDGKVIETTPTT